MPPLGEDVVVGRAERRLGVSDEQDARHQTPLRPASGDQVEHPAAEDMEALVADRLSVALTLGLPPGPRGIELRLRPTAGEEVAPRLLPRPQHPLEAAEVVPAQRLLLLGGVGRVHGVGLVAGKALHVDTPSLGEVSREQIADRIVALADGGLAALAGESEADEIEDLVDGRRRVRARQHHEGREAVWLRTEHDPSGLGHAEQLADRRLGIGEVHEHRLARDEIERRIREVERHDIARLETEAMPEIHPGGALSRRNDPFRFTVDPRDLHT